MMQTYDPADAIVFYRLGDAFGDFSNFARYPININGGTFHTSEAAYQAARFPDHPEVQRLIADQENPMETKALARQYQALTRPDWITEDGGFRVAAMRWVVVAKLFQNFKRFSAVLDSTGDRLIIEQTRKDDFWGAILQPDGTLKGANMLGHLLVDIRAGLPNFVDGTALAPVNENDFKFFDQIAETIRLDRTS